MQRIIAIISGDAIIEHIDGNLYVPKCFTFDHKSLTVVPRDIDGTLLRIDTDMIDRDGEVHVVIARMGDSLKLTAPLPHGVYLDSDETA